MVAAIKICHHGMKYVTTLALVLMVMLALKVVIASTATHANATLPTVPREQTKDKLAKQLDNTTIQFQYIMIATAFYVHPLVVLMVASALVLIVAHEGVAQLHHALLTAHQIIALTPKVHIIIYWRFGG